MSERAASKSRQAEGPLQVSVTQLRSAPLRGALKSISPEVVVLLLPEGEVSVSAEFLPKLGAAKPPVVDEQASWGRLWLRCGSELPVEAVRTSRDGSELECVLPNGLNLSPSTLTVSPDLVRCLRLPNSPPSLNDQWEKLASRGPLNDLLVVPRKGGETLDYLEGFVESIGDESVTLLLEEDSLVAPVEKVYGVVFADGGEAELGEANAVRPAPQVRSLGGVVLNAAKLRLRGQQLELGTNTGLGFRVPFDSLVQIDFSAGRVVHLSDLSPLAPSHRPLFGTPEGWDAAPLASGIRLDSGFWGRPLALRGESDSSPEREEFEKGLAIRSGAEVSFAPPAGFERFDAVVGIDPDVVGPRRIRLLIEGDGRTLTDHTFSDSAPRTEVRFKLGGARRLKLRVERLESLDATLHFGDARLIR